MPPLPEAWTIASIGWPGASACGQQLEPGRDVAERADRRRAADRDHERAPAARAQLAPPPARARPRGRRRARRGAARRRPAGRAGRCRRARSRGGSRRPGAAARARSRGPWRAAAAAVWRQWFDCTPPAVTSVSAPCRERLRRSGTRACGSCCRRSARPVASSRLTRICGPPSSRREPRQRLERGRQMAEAGAGEAGELH